MSSNKCKENNVLNIKEDTNICLHHNFFICSICGIEHTETCKLVMEWEINKCNKDGQNDCKEDPKKCHEFPMICQEYAKKTNECKNIREKLECNICKSIYCLKCFDNKDLEYDTHRFLHKIYELEEVSLEKSTFKKDEYCISVSHDIKYTNKKCNITSDVYFNYWKIIYSIYQYDKENDPDLLRYLQDCLNNQLMPDLIDKLKERNDKFPIIDKILIKNKFSTTEREVDFNIENLLEISISDISKFINIYPFWVIMKNIRKKLREDDNEVILNTKEEINIKSRVVFLKKYEMITEMIELLIYGDYKFRELNSIYNCLKTFFEISCRLNISTKLNSFMFYNNEYGVNFLKFISYIMKSLLELIEEKKINTINNIRLNKIYEVFIKILHLYVNIEDSIEITKEFKKKLELKKKSKKDSKNTGLSDLNKEEETLERKINIFNNVFENKEFLKSPNSPNSQNSLKKDVEFEKFKDIIDIIKSSNYFSNLEYSQILELGEYLRQNENTDNLIKFVCELFNNQEVNFNLKNLIIDSVLCMLYSLILSKEGLEYLLKHKNLKSLFNDYLDNPRIELIKFLYMIVRQCKNLNITQSEDLLIIQRNIVQNFNLDSFEDKKTNQYCENNYIINIYYMMKMFIKSKNVYQRGFSFSYISDHIIRLIDIYKISSEDLNYDDKNNDQKIEDHYLIVDNLNENDIDESEDFKITNFFLTLIEFYSEVYYLNKDTDKIKLSKDFLNIIVHDKVLEFINSANLKIESKIHYIQTLINITFLKIYKIDEELDKPLKSDESDQPLKTEELDKPLKTEESLKSKEIDQPYKSEELNKQLKSEVLPKSTNSEKPDKSEEFKNKLIKKIKVFIIEQMEKDFLKEDIDKTNKYLSRILEFIKQYIKKENEDTDKEPSFVKKLIEIYETKIYIKVTDKKLIDDGIKKDEKLDKKNVMKYLQLTIDSLIDYNKNLDDLNKIKDNSIDLEYKINKFEENNKKVYIKEIINEDILNSKNSELDYLQFFNFSNSSIIKCANEDQSFSNILKMLLFFINSNQNEEIILSSLRIINKLMYFSPDLIQKRLQPIFKEDKYKPIIKLFGRKFNQIYDMIKYYTETNMIDNEKLIQLIRLLTNYIRFLQLLAENFNTSFHNLIFMEGNNSLFKIVSLNNLRELDDNNDIKMMPVIESIIDFIIEYEVSYKFSNTKDENNNSHNHEEKKENVNIYEQIDNKNFIVDLITKFIDCRLFEIEKDNNRNIWTNKEFLLKLLHIIIEFDNDDWSKDQTNLKVKNFQDSIKRYIGKFFELTIKNLNKSESEFKFDTDEEYRNKFLQLYTTDSDFNETLEWKLCLRLYLLGRKYSLLKSPKRIKNDKSLINQLILFLDTITIGLDIRSKSDNIKNHFFIQPRYFYYLSQQSKKYFMENVNRENIASKLTSFIKAADYFTFEMFHNKFIAEKIDDKHIFKTNERWNYLFIIIEQLFIIFSDIYTFNDPLLYFTCICHISFIAYIIIIWNKEFLTLSFQKHMIETDEKTFIYTNRKKELENFNSFITINKNKFDKNYYEKWNNDIEPFERLKIYLLHVFLLNTDINVYIFNLILIFLFFITSNYIYLAISVIFIANQIKILTNIFNAMRLKWRQFSILLLFTYLVIYVIMNFTYINLRFLFEGNDVYSVSSDSTVTENLCPNLISCFLNMINYGMRSGGGIGDVIPKISSSDSMFYGLFFYNIGFHIIIILILGNMFFGLILDAFNTLREKSELNENDNKNICFICQEDRDSFLLSNKDPTKTFEDHQRKDHNMWKYISFITYINLLDPNDLSYIEKGALESIKNSDFSWLPINKKEIDDEVKDIAKKIDDSKEILNEIKNENEICEKIESIQKNSERIFEKLEKTEEKFVLLNKQTDEKFDLLNKQKDEKFDLLNKQTDEKFDLLNKKTDEKFDLLEKKLEELKISDSQSEKLSKEISELKDLILSLKN